MNNNNGTSLLNDCYHVGGKYFPTENTNKGPENGPQALVAQSDKQKGARLNANKPGEANSTWGREGNAFPPADNSKDSRDEQATFAGDRDPDVSLNLVSGQINSAEARLIPVPLSGEPETIRANVKFQKTKGDVKENRI